MEVERERGMEREGRGVEGRDMEEREVGMGGRREWWYVFSKIFIIKHFSVAGSPVSH
jgi:hypothetical protein